jgi:G3E family GTPase
MLAQPNTQPHPPLPVTIVSGYLGAGKTTLVNAILAGDHGLRIAVLVNDFGKVAVDEALIVNTDGDVVALANGCMCCQVGGDLYDAIDRILRMRERFDHLLIETSGVADPANLAQIAVAEPDLEMSRTIVLVDAINFIEVLQDPRLKDTILRQLRAADSIFFTKTDEPTATCLARLRSALDEAGIQTSGSVLKKNRACHWHLLRRNSGDGGSFSGARPLRPHSLPFASWSWEGDCMVGPAGLLAFAQEPSLHIYRLKGRLLCPGGKAILIHKVGAETITQGVDGSFVISYLVAIGAKPDFEPLRVEAAWARSNQRTSNILP